MKYKLVKSKIKDNCIEEYIRLHNELPAEIQKEFRKIGIKTVVCFLDGYDLYVFTEFIDDNASNLQDVTLTPVLNTFVEQLEIKVKDTAIEKIVTKNVFIFDDRE